LAGALKRQGVHVDIVKEVAGSPAAINARPPRRADLDPHDAVAEEIRSAPITGRRVRRSVLDKTTPTWCWPAAAEGHRRFVAHWITYDLLFKVPCPARLRPTGADTDESFMRSIDALVDTLLAS